MDIPQQFPPLPLPQLPYSLALLLSNLIARSNTAGAVRAQDQVRMRMRSEAVRAQRSKQERM